MLRPSDVADAGRARVIRLVGDGLFANVIAGIEPAPAAAELDAVLRSLLPAGGSAGR